MNAIRTIQTTRLSAACGLALALILLCGAVSAWASEAVCNVVRVTLPPAWEEVTAPETKDGLCSAVYGTADHTASVMLGTGKANSLSASDIARDVAALLNVHPTKEEHLDLVHFSGQAGNVPVTCSVGANDATFIFVCAFGNQNAAKPFIRKGLASATHRALLPK